MDGMRKIPDKRAGPRFPGAASAQAADLVPNPFGGNYESLATTTTRCCAASSTRFGFDYEFASATDYYKSGRFDTILKRVAERFDAIMGIMLPTLGEERRATYSPFLPISPKTAACSTCR